MRKIKLELEQLTVESFHTQPEAGGRGTIAGNQEEDEYADAAASGLLSRLFCSCKATCDGGATCPLSCGGPAPTGCNSPYCQNEILSKMNACPVDEPVNPGGIV